MTKNEIINSIAYCGLVCGICQPEGTCRCKSENHCGKRLAPNGCYQYNCCTKKGIDGCWECSEAPCGEDMHSPEKVKIRAFIKCIKEDGLDNFASYIIRNADNGIVYHRSGIFGDYDLNTEDEVLNLLRFGLTVNV